MIFVPRVDALENLIARYKIATKALLGVGHVFGTFFSEIKKRNIFLRVMAVEPNRDLVITCRERGLEVLELPIEEFQPTETELFDVVASFEVIEHLFSPADFVIHMGRLLKPGRIMLLTCPNGKGFDIETLGVLSN